MAADEEQEGVEEGDAVEVPNAPLLDTARLAADAKTRYDRAKDNPNRRGDPDKAYMGQVLGLMEAQEQAISNALHSDAEVWLAKSDSTGIGPTARNHLLAAKVVNGDYNK